MQKRSTPIFQLSSALFCIVSLCAHIQNARAQAVFSGAGLNGNKLYYSAQNGGKSTLTGSLKITKSDSIYEHGSAHLSGSGPIIISPTDFSMTTGMPMSETFTGAVTVDPSIAPAPGHKETASITGKYDLFYACPLDLPCKPAGAFFIGAPWQCEVGYGPPAGHCSAGHGPPGGPHSMVEESGTEIETLTVYSVFDSISGPACVQMGDTVTYSAIGYPAGGSYLWSNGKKGHYISLVITRPQNIAVTYTIDGVSYKASLDVNICCKCRDITIRSQPPTAPLGPNNASINIDNSNNITLPVGSPAIFYTAGCKQADPVWEIDSPGYILVRPSAADSAALLASAGKLSRSPGQFTWPIMVSAAKPGKANLCASFMLDSVPCKKCVTITFGALLKPKEENNSNQLDNRQNK